MSPTKNDCADVTDFHPAISGDLTSGNTAAHAKLHIRFTQEILSPTGRVIRFYIDVKY